MRTSRLAIAACLLLPATAQAGEMPYYEAFVVEADPADTTPPATPRVELLEVKRGVGPRDEGCGTTISSTDDFGSVRLELGEAGGDEVVGYRFLPIDGSVPFGSAYAGPVVVREPVVYLGWIDGAQDDQEPLDFTLHVVAVDRAGNESEPVAIHVRDPGRSEGGCSVGGAGSGGLLLAGVALLLRRSKKGRNG